VDSKGNAWRPGLEFVVRSGTGTDSVAQALSTRRRSMTIANTPDPEIYRYGLHGKEFWVNLTVGPGTYRVTLHLADTGTGARQTVLVNGEEVLADRSVAEVAGGTFRALRKSLETVSPRHGIIEIRCVGTGGKEAWVQAIEVEPRPRA